MELYVKTRAEWRKWLKKNHNSDDRIWLVFYRKETGKPVIPYDDAVEEALCFGWIDGKIKKINDEYYVRQFSHRRQRSQWSQLNMNRARKMIDKGLMQPEGLKEYMKTIDNPGLVYSNENEGNSEIPEDLMKALELNRPALRNFLGFTESNRRLYLLWLNTAKRAETRQKRISKIVEFSEKNQKPGMM
jgi:uncharacterized protein YdeI (YjbR/CyaY-like superfamily)